MHGDAQSRRRQLHVLRKECPRIDNCLSFHRRGGAGCSSGRHKLGVRLVAEGKVSQHFKQRVVSSCLTHIIQVIVLTTSAHAPLHSYRPWHAGQCSVGEPVLELHHASVREQQSAVGGRQQR